MDLVSFVGSKVHITLRDDGFYFQGRALNADENSITILDLRGRKVCLTKDSILTIREVRE